MNPFEPTPKNAALDARLAALSPKQRELFEKALREKEAKARAAPPPVPAAPADDTVQRRQLFSPAPLSIDQERLWFIQQLDPESPVYNIYSAFRYRAPLVLGPFVSAVNEVVRRHEILRTTFPSIDGRPMQVVEPAYELVVPLIDLRDLPEEAREAEAQNVAATLVRRPFYLDRLPLLRLPLIQVDAEEYIQPFAIHHIATDRITSEIVLAELRAIYAHYLAGLPSPLPEIPVQFADFAVWQRNALAEEGRLAQSLAYWKKKLAGAPELHSLPTDRPRPPMQSAKGGRRRMSLGRAQSEAFRAFSNERQVTLFIAGLAVLQSLMVRLSGEDRVIVGTPMDYRTEKAELANCLGFFLNQIILDSDLSGNPTMNEVVARVRDTALGAYRHGDLPFARLVEELSPERDLSRTPYTQVVFLFLNLTMTPQGGSLLPGVDASDYWVDAERTQFDINFALWDDGPRFSGFVEYSTDLWDAPTMDRLREQYRLLIDGMLQNPKAHLWDLPLLSKAESHQITREWADPQPSPRLQPLHVTFEEQARRNPQAIALTFEGGEMAYGELSQSSHLLAEKLILQGATPGHPIALSASRGPQLLVAILAILKTGAFYVPIDPALPPERILFLLEDSNSQLWLQGPETPSVPYAGTILSLGVLPGGGTTPDSRGEGGSFPASTAGGEMESAGSHPPPALETKRTPAPGTGPTPAGSPKGLDFEASEDGRPGSSREGGYPLDPAFPAYTIYTSGSTGTPKGVTITHAQVHRLFTATASWFHPTSQDVWTFFHSYAFDFSVWEIWGALLHGGRLVIVPYTTSRSPAAFAGWLHDQKVTLLSQTPSAFLQLAEVPAQKLDSLRAVVFGGEALDPRSLAPWIARHGDEKPALINMYGITETTVHVTYRRIHREDAEGMGSPIGLPIPDLTVHVVDPEGRPAPLGITGEMLVGGAGVAMGYPGRADLTAQRFVPDPWSEEPGARLYRSGDLARRRSDGQLEYLGRGDQQLKIRGFRIEPAEIESVLLKHPSVGQVAVIARQDGNAAERRLVAYWVPAAGEGLPSVADLRNHLSALLPEHMIPAAFVPLAALPLTDNGKLDRKALPAPSGERPSVGRFAAPRTTAEEVLAAIWAQVLGIEQVGVDDNFFALGGDSILSLRVVAEAGKRGFSLALQDLFRHQTIADLAAAARRPGDEAVTTAPFSLLSEADRALLPPDVEDAYPLARLQAGMLFHMELDREEPPYHNIDSLQLGGRLSPAHFQEAVRRVVAHHPVLRTSFHLTGFSEPLQLVHRHAELPVEVEDISALSPEQQQEKILARVTSEKRRLFDLTQAPQLRLHLYLRGDDRFQLTSSENHAIVDGWSIHAILTEVFELHYSLLEGEDPTPPAPLPTTYRDYIALERRAAASGEAREFWERTLVDAPLADLPAWPPAVPPDDGGRRMRGVSFGLRADLNEGLHALARRAAVPFKTVLLAAHVKMLSLLSGQTDVVTGLITNGRLEVPGGDEVRGLFLNTVPLRVPVGGTASWLELVQAVFRAEEEMLPYRRYPLADLQQADRPLFTVPFNYVHFHVVRDLAQSGRLALIDFERAEGGNYPILVAFHQAYGSGDIGCELEYDSHRVDRDRVAFVMGILQRVLEALAATPAARPETLALLGEEARARILPPVAGTLRPALLLTDLFLENAAGDPARTALLSARGDRTYGELLRRARSLAGVLVRQGAGPDVPIGLLANRGPEMVEGVLGILLAGAAYLPLDPRQPADRLAAMLEDARAPIVLADRELAKDLPFSGIALFFGDEAEAGEADALPRPAPENLAYLIYTSGSTGRPKGVAIEHRNAVALLGWCLATFSPEETALVLASTSLGFDMSVFELFATLSAGGALALVDDLLAWPQHPAASRVTLVNTVPSVLAEHLRHQDFPPGLRTVNLGGEALKPEVVRRAFQAGARRLVNLYGPTEDTTYSTWAEIDPSLGDLPPIGRTLAGTRAVLESAAGDPVPEGASGEVYLEGAGLARGYLNRPDWTAERFVPNPYGEAGGRRYRTGDLARRDADGQLRYLGRIDQQLKLHGVRIEPGEIEAALEAHPEIAEAAVLLNQDDPTHSHLVAYYANNPISAFSSSTQEPGEGARRPRAPESAGPEASGRRAAGETPDLRAYLRGRLPEPMIPTIFIELPELPRNLNGKVDRRALAALDLQPQAPKLIPYATPATPAEELLAGIWAETLGLPSPHRIGRSDNFFDLSGNSLTATQVGHRVREVFGIEIPLRRLFERATLSDLAAEIDTAGRPGEGSAAPSRTSAIERVARDQPIPASMIQEWAWYLIGGTIDSKLNMPMAARFGGGLDPALMAAALTDLTRRHESLRTRFAEIDGRLCQLFAAPAPFDLPEIDLRALPEERRDPFFFELAKQEARRPFDLAAGPLFRATYVGMEADRHALLLNIHHSISDGWSLEVLKREIPQLFLAYVNGQPADLPELPLQYGDYATWQRRVFAESELENQLAYWRRQLADRPPVLELPADRPRPAKLGSRAVSHGFFLDLETLASLRRLARQEGATLGMILTAAVDVLLYRYTGRDDLFLNAIVSGRNRPELAGLIGLFMNTVVLRADLSGRPAFRTLLPRVRNAVLEGFAHQDVPFMRLLADLFPGAALDRTLFSRVNFNLLSFSGAGGPEGEPLPIETLSLMDEQVKVDLHVIIQEIPEHLYFQLVGAVDLFEPESVKAMAADIEALLGEIAEHPDRPIDQLLAEPRHRGWEAKEG
jgi:amino acid adenylation domain-containing protein